MKKSITIATVGAALIIAAPVAHADIVADESASICSSLSLVSSGYSDWATIEISMLQLKHDVSRAGAVSIIRAAAVEYCPEYAAYVPTK